MQILVNKVTESEKKIVTEAGEAQYAAMLNSSVPEEKELSKSLPGKVQQEREKMMIQEPVINGNVAAETDQTRQDLEKEKTEKQEKQEPTEHIVKLSTTVAFDRMVNGKTIAALAAAQKGRLYISISIIVKLFQQTGQPSYWQGGHRKSDKLTGNAQAHTLIYARMEEEYVYILYIYIYICIYIYVYI